MARKGSDSKGAYVIVEKGDVLTQIAVDYAGGYSKYKTLAAINDISNPNLIYVGQKIYLTKAGTAKKVNTTSAPYIKQFGLLSMPEEDKEQLFATWNWSKSNTESYKVLWTYYTAKGVELQGTNTTITVDKYAPALSRQSIYDVPDGATKVRFKVMPIAKTKDDKNKTAYWTASWSSIKTWTDDTPLATPTSQIKIELDGYKLTASVEDVSISGADSIVFQIIQNNSKTYATSKPIKLKTGCASYSHSVNPNGEYKVRCYAYNTKKKTKSDWSNYSDNVITIPASPDEITSVKPIDKTTVYIEWTAVASADTYDLQYATKKEYFDNVGGDVTDEQDIDKTSITIYNMETGTEYFFRVRASNSSGDSEWTEPKSVIIGDAPAAPTTWSSTTTAIVGEPVSLYWIHNPKDNSSQTYAQLKLFIDGVEQGLITIQNTTDEEEKDKTSVYELDTSSYSEGVKIEWQVRTQGIVESSYGDWSDKRVIDVYARPTLELTLLDKDLGQFGDLSETPLATFPFYIHGLTGPATQSPIGYSVSITSNQVYETVDTIGNPKTVNLDEAVYTEYFDSLGPLDVKLDPGKIDLANGMNYTVTVIASMNSGLVVEEARTFTVNWTEISYEPNAEIGIDFDTLTATVRPYCTDHAVVLYKVTLADDVYTKTTETVEYAYGEVMPGVLTTTGEVVYSGVTVDEEEIYYCEEVVTTDKTDVYLAVYRREYDGKFTEIATGLDAAINTAVTDPHPALDYARYRIVATSKSTGTVSYFDMPAYPVGCTSIVIQWDDEWSNFDVTDVSDQELLIQPPWVGSLLKLDYNVDVNESPTPEVEFVEYIGREHPVSYYGTQLGESASWSAVIPKSDKETIYALRRLSKWTGNVYVREPSGVGYWANIGVSFNQKHGSVTVPVSLSIKRVEGGV